MMINLKQFKSRLEVYHNQTQPLIDYYKEQGILKSVDGTVDMKDVFKAIVEILGAVKLWQLQLSQKEKFN